MIVLVGASASGKTELAKILYHQYGYSKCVTTTTRQPRQNEKNGIDYHFIDTHMFMNLEKEHAFLEVTRYQDHYYGIQRKDVKVNGVVIVDPSGANAIYDKIGDDAFIVYVKTSKPLRQKRMEDRGDDPKLIQNRLYHDEHIFNEHAFHKLHLVIENEMSDLNDTSTLVHQAYQRYILSIN